MSLSKNKYFAAFIMTYERPEALLNTIEEILKQTYKPEKILIVDNSISSKIMDLFHREFTKKSGNVAFEYYNVGYNSGPAGAAKIGLEILANEGYSWIFWGDDDDPPKYEDCFERLLTLGSKLSVPAKCGVIGCVGHYFNSGKGTLERPETEVLQRTSFIEVDNVAGGMCKIVNGDVVRLGVLPNEKLFFGFEELDFDIKVKKKGYSLLIDSQLNLRYREQAGNIEYIRKLGKKKVLEKLWRDYYSVRNLMIIFTHNKMYSASLILIVKKMLNVLHSFRFGYKYGLKFGRLVLSGIYDGVLGKGGLKEGLR